MIRVPLGVLAALLLTASLAGAQAPATPPVKAGAAPESLAAVPVDYRIGPEDVLSVVFWREKDMSAEVVVRPDGKISLPLLNDVDAAGYTPEQLRVRLMQAAAKYIEEPTASVVVKTVNSRRVFIQGSIGRPAAYPLINSMNVLQLIALAGGLAEYANSKEIVIIRTENGKTTSFNFNFRDVVKGKNVNQNIELRPGDTVVVP